MAHSRLLFRDAARGKVLAGATALAAAIRVTLGPKSKSVLIGDRRGTPQVCNDGVTIARKLKLEDPDENLGAQMLRQAAEHTGDVVGDGTSASALLAHAMFAEGLRDVVAAASAIDVKRAIDEGVTEAICALRALSRPISSAQERIHVAIVAADNDASIDALVGEAVGRVGAEGIVSVEEAKGTETTPDVVEGMRFDRGYLSPYFVTDAEKMLSMLDRPYEIVEPADEREATPACNRARRQGRGAPAYVVGVPRRAAARRVGGAPRDRGRGQGGVDALTGAMARRAGRRGVLLIPISDAAPAGRACRTGAVVGGSRA